MARYLVDRFGPTLVNTPYQTRRKMTETPGLYEGEVALHIAIVHKDAELVKFLLRNGARLDVHTIGAFFQPGRVYFGETPFAFAASVGQKEIVKILLDHAQKRGGAKYRHEVMTGVDAYGNTALHMCVMNNQREMHDFLIEECNMPEDLRNNSGMTPFIQAAYEGNHKMFHSILRRRFSVVWTYGPVTNYSLTLEGIDTVGKTPRSHDRSVIDVILKRRHLELLNHPIVIAVLEMKWKRFGRFAFLRNVAFYTVFLAAFTWQVNMHSTERTVAEWHTFNRQVIEWFTFVCSFVMFVQHVRDLGYFVRAYYRQLENVRLNFTNDSVPLSCIPGSKLERKTNPMQIPRLLRVVEPRRGLKLGGGGNRGVGAGGGGEKSSLSTHAISTAVVSGLGFDISDIKARGKKAMWTRLKAVFRVTGSSKTNNGKRGGRGGGGGGGGDITTRSTRKLGLPSFRVRDRDEDPVYVLQNSLLARMHWRMIREHWLRERAVVGLFQVIKQFQLLKADDYDDRVVVLMHVNVLRARNLPASDQNGSSDPYCVVNVAPGVKVSTQTLRVTLNPKWSRAYSFTAPPGIRKSDNKLVFSVMDQDDFDFDDVLGVACVPYHDIPYVQPGMIPPGPVWLDLTSHEEAMRGTSGGGGRNNNNNNNNNNAKGVARGEGSDISSKSSSSSFVKVPRFSWGGEWSSEPAGGGEGKPQILVEAYYEVHTVDEQTMDKTTGAGAGAGVVGVGDGDGDGDERSTSPSSLPSSSSGVHTSFERDIGNANQVRALAKRLYRLGYTMRDSSHRSRTDGSFEGRNDGGGRDKSEGESEDDEEENTFHDPDDNEEGGGGKNQGGLNVDVPPSPTSERGQHSSSFAEREKLKQSASLGTSSGNNSTDNIAGAFNQRWRAFKLRWQHAFNALYFYVESVLLPQPSLVFNLVHICLQSAHFFMWLNQDEPSVADDLVFSVAALTAWGFTLYFAAGYRTIGHLTVVVMGCVEDVVRFSSLWCVVLFAFSQALYILTARWAGPDRDNEFSQGSMLWWLFAVATTATVFDDVIPDMDTDESEIKSMVYFLGIVFQVQMSMLMLNIIIAMFNQTYSTVSSKAEQTWRFQWALKILLAEAQLDPDTKFKHRLGEDAEGPHGKVRVHNFEINTASESVEDGSLEQAVTSLLKSEREDE